MRKGLFFLFAALLIVGLPLSSALAAGTQVFKAKDMDVDYWEVCPYYGMPSTEWFPAGPQQEFGKNLLIRHYVGTEKFNARVKRGDVGWNRNVHGTASIYDYDQVVSGDGTVMVAAMNALARQTSRLPRYGSVHVSILMYTIELYGASRTGCDLSHRSITVLFRSKKSFRMTAAISAVSFHRILQPSTSRTATVSGISISLRSIISCCT